MFGVNANAGIFNGKITLYPIIVPTHGNGAPFGGVFNGIGNEVAKRTGKFHIRTNQVAMTVNFEVQCMPIINIVGLRIIK